MSKKLYVGSLPYAIGNNELEKLFSSVGTVQSAKVIIDPETGKSKGFGFVEMSSEEEAKAAIKELNGTPQSGRNIVVSEARPDNRSGGGGRGGRGGFGGGGGRDSRGGGFGGGRDRDGRGGGFGGGRGGDRDGRGGGHGGGGRDRGGRSGGGFGGGGGRGGNSGGGGRDRGGNW